MTLKFYVLYCRVIFLIVVEAISRLVRMFNIERKINQIQVNKDVKNKIYNPRL